MPSIAVIAISTDLAGLCILEPSIKRAALVGPLFFSADPRDNAPVALRLGVRAAQKWPPMFDAVFAATGMAAAALVHVINIEGDSGRGFEDGTGRRLADFRRLRNSCRRNE